MHHDSPEAAVPELKIRRTSWKSVMAEWTEKSNESVSHTPGVFTVALASLLPCVGEELHGHFAAARRAEHVEVELCEIRQRKRNQRESLQGRKRDAPFE